MQYKYDKIIKIPGISEYKFGIIDNKLAIIDANDIPKTDFIYEPSKQFDYPEYVSCSGDDFLVLKKIGGKTGVLDNNLNQIIPFEYDDIIIHTIEKHPGRFTSFVALKNSKYGVIDDKGEIKFDFEYEEIEIYPKYIGIDGVCGIDIVAKKDNKFGIINSYVPCEYDEIILYSNYDIIAKKNGKYGMINYENKVNIDFVYDEIIPYDINLCIASKNKKYGAINDYNENVLDFIYKNANDCKEAIKEAKRIEQEEGAKELEKMINVLAKKNGNN